MSSECVSEWKEKKEEARDENVDEGRLHAG